MTEPGPLRYITLADDDYESLGLVAYGGADWTINCGRCPYAKPSTDPATGVTDLLAHIEREHSVVPHDSPRPDTFSSDGLGHVLDAPDGPTEV